MYREFEEQRRGYKQMMEKSDDMYEKMSRFMEDMSVGPVPLAKEPIIADQHYGISDLSGFQSYQGVPSAFHTLTNNSSFFNMAMPSNWQTPIPSYLGTPNSQPHIPSHPEIEIFSLIRALLVLIRALSLIRELNSGLLELNSGLRELI
nr:hypothetical protein [Tanacetum cinerariifolium]